MIITAAAAAALVACGGSSSPVNVVNPPPVNAQSAFSNASLSGTYALSFIGASVANGGIAEIDNGIGSLQLDGSGHISGGSATSYGSAGTCAYTLSGSYSVQQSGQGAATLTLSGAQSNPNTCGTGGTGVLALNLGQGGASFAFAESDYATTASIEAGTAIKQQ